MTAYEITLLVCGCIFLVLSFFVGNKTADKENADNESSNAGEIYNESEMEALAEKVSERLNRKAESIVDEANTQLEHISNEKIMAVNDFSEQLLERIKHNHEEVVFMYSMLQKKEEQLKAAAREADVATRKYTNVSAEQNVVNSSSSDNVETVEIRSNAAEPGLTALELLARKKQEKERGALQKEIVQKETVKKEVPKKETVKKVSDTQAGQKKILPPPAEKSFEENRNAEILKLYRQKKSIVEISKILGLGQGEVKLVVDLYGRK